MRRAVAFTLVTLVAAPGLSLTMYLTSRPNFGLFGMFGAKKQPPPTWVLHSQKVRLSKMDFKGAERPCGNWAWVAGVSEMAALSGARLDQTYLVDRLYGGSVCLPSPGDVAALAKQISHEYVLADGQKFTLAAQFKPGVPTQPDPLIYSLRQDRPLMLMWGNKTYLLTGMSYDEYIAPTGNKMFIVTELRLFDPLGDADKREVIFSRDQDNPDEVNGVLEVSVHTK
ncbi:MAG TPA: hypothetical protein VG498_15325 [Terriglobales bacterium]|nr:hypothetical protein [Terriglobales bacterium]